MKKTYIIITSLIACLILYLVEQALSADYVTKTVIKVILFLGIPFVYSIFIEKPSIKDGLKPERKGKGTLKLGLSLGLASFIMIFVGYFVLGKYIDFDDIAMELGTKSKITSSNFIVVGLYITFANSFLEELFFRGFIFLNLFNQDSKKFAYVYSSVLFSIYHIAIFKTWFSPVLMVIALLGLISVGIIFNWMDTKTGNFMNSWLIHILADSAIIIIGMKIFNII